VLKPPLIWQNIFIHIVVSNLGKITRIAHIILLLFNPWFIIIKTWCFVLLSLRLAVRAKPTVLITIIILLSLL